VILLLNGAFGVGKTSVARVLALRLPRSVVFDPELIGIALQRAARLFTVDVADFQDLRAWRVLTIAGIRIARLIWPNVIVPMAFSELAYLDQIRDSLRRFEPALFHVCLVAPVDVVHARLNARGADADRHEWQYRRAAECCAAHRQPAFGEQVSTDRRDVADVAGEVLARIAPAVLSRATS
jgi:chloramphenicol 3-O-phosphotransferase